MLCRKYIIVKNGSDESSLSTFNLFILQTNKFEDQIMPVEFDETLMTVSLLGILSLTLLRKAKTLPLNFSEDITGPWKEDRERRDYIWMKRQ